MSSGALVIIACSEADTRVDPARYFNLSANNTQVVKTAGGRTQGAINNIYAVEQRSRIGMIVVVQHSNCPWSPGTVEQNIRSDIQFLKSSPYVRNDIPIVGYILDVTTGQLREVNVPRTAPDEEARRQVLSQMGDFGPFWS